VRIVYVVGARPNIVKIAPVLAAARGRLPEARHVLVHTGQHYDAVMSDAIMADLGMPAPDHFLGVGSGSLAEQTARAMTRLEVVLRRERPDMVVVGGDVNSTLATALVCAQLRVPYAHVESGLRSFDRSMPEEINRIVADEFGDLLFVHSDDAVENLLREGIEPERVHFVGNTMIDSLVAVRERVAARKLAAELGLSHRGYVLVTLHRPALVDGPLLLPVVERLVALARELPVVFPAHPRTRKRLGERRSPGLHIVDPVGYVEFLSLEADAAAVLTDSGGVQEETTYLGVPCFTLRDNTERPVTLTAGTNTLLGLDPERIDDVLPALAAERELPRDLPELWDGRAGDRVADVLARHLSPLVTA